MQTLIVLAGDLIKGEYLDDLIKRSFSLIIAVDGGFSHCLALGIDPDILIGDFDSLSQDNLFLAKERGILIQEFPSKKDLTDSELAFELAIKKGSTFISVLGALGGRRADHFLANIFLFNQFYNQVSFSFIDGYQKIFLLLSEKKILIKGERGDYISILPFGSKLKGLKGEGFLYPLKSLSIEEGKSLGLSNELIAKEAVVSLEEGKAIIIQSKREIT